MIILSSVWCHLLNFCQGDVLSTKAITTYDHLDMHYGWEEPESSPPPTLFVTQMWPEVFPRALKQPSDTGHDSPEMSLSLMVTQYRKLVSGSVLLLMEDLD